LLLNALRLSGLKRSLPAMTVETGAERSGRQPMPRIDIAEAIVHSLPLGSGAYLDKTVKGFMVICNAASKSYVLQRDLNRRAVRVKLGRVGEIGAEAARREALKALELFEQGRNPNLEKRVEAAKGMTLAEAFVLYKESEPRSPKTLEIYEGIFRNHLQQWERRTMLDIGSDRAGVRKLHEQITAKVKTEAEALHDKLVAKEAKRKQPSKKGVPEFSAHAGWATANNALRLLKGIYNRARVEVPSLPEDPTVNVNWHPDIVRQTSLTVDELKGWYEQVERLSSTIKRDYWISVLLTGGRRNQIAESRWEHIDLENGLWHFPKPKGGEERQYTVPVSEYLLDRLKARKEENAKLFPKSPWVFPSDKAISGHLTIPRNDKQGLPMAHALRHTYRTHSLLAGISDVHSHLLMNHKLEGVNFGYISRAVTLEELRKAQEKITDHFLVHFGVKLTPQPVTERKPATLFELELNRKVVRRHRHA
jgi:integrase